MAVGVLIGIGSGIVSVCPIKSTSESLMPFADKISFKGTSYKFAIEFKVSPVCTICSMLFALLNNRTGSLVGEGVIEISLVGLICAVIWVGMTPVKPVAVA